MDAYSLGHKCQDFSKHNDESYFNTIVKFVVVDSFHKVLLIDL